MNRCGFSAGLGLAILLTGHAKTVGAKEPTKPPTPPSAMPTSAPDPVDLAIQKVLLSHVDEVQSCYHKALVSSPDIEGVMVVRFKLNDDGHVSEAKIASSSINEATLAKCILDLTGTYRFPPMRYQSRVIPYKIVLQRSDSECSTETTSEVATGTGPMPSPKIVRAALIQKDQVMRLDPHLPTVVKRQHCGETLRSSYKLCVALDGTISSVSIVAPIVGADHVILDALYKWRYKPQQVPVCFVQNFEHEVPPCPQKHPPVCAEQVPEIKP